VEIKRNSYSGARSFEAHSRNRGNSLSTDGLSMTSSSAGRGSHNSANNLPYGVNSKKKRKSIKIKHHLNSIGQKTKAHVVTRPLSIHYGRHKLRYQLALLAIIPLMVPVIVFLLLQPNYKLSAQAAKLVGTPDQTLVKKGLTFDKSSGNYYLNQKDIGINNNSPANTKTLGSKGAYSLKIASNLNSGGVTYYDNETGLSFTLTPQFKTHNAKNNGGQFIYPQGSGNLQAVYTVKQNGLREDVVINHKTGDSQTLSYKLNLPKYLQAKMLPNGSIGIYSASPNLYGHINYSSSNDQQVIERARLNSPKNYLAFALTAPTVEDSSHKANSAAVHLTLNGNTVTMTATKLASLSYPISIDPSVIINSANQFSLGNNESGVDINPASNQISESGLSGADITSWNTTTSLQQKTYLSFSAEYNGYIYDIGGDLNGASGNEIEYAQITSSGNLNTSISCPGGWSTSGGTWCYIVTPASLPTSITSGAGVAYNGYFYLISGNDNGARSTNVWYASLNPTNGSVGSFSQVASVQTGTTLNSGAVYNGYIYLFGGDGGAAPNATTEYAQLGSDGTITNISSCGSGWTKTSVTFGGAWCYNAAGTPTAPGALEQTATVAYNGYLYMVGGVHNVSPQSEVDFTAINSNGSYGSWTSSGSFPVTIKASTLVAWDGYLYMVTGNAGGASTNSYFAPINTDGSVGSWTLLAAQYAVADSDVAAFAYNGYLYSVGGDGSSIIQTAYYAQIKPEGWLSSQQSNATGLATTIQSAGTAMYNNEVYVVGGVNNSGTILNTLEYATASATGGLPSFTTYGTNLPSGIQGGAAVAANGYLYLVGGYNGTTYLTSTECIQLNASNVPTGSWSNCGAFGATGLEYRSVVYYNNYLYAIGGYTGSAVSPNVDCASVPSSGGTLTWSACTTNALGTGGTSALYEGSAVVSHGYIYILGGNTGSSASGAVYYAQINLANGNLGSWNVSGNTLNTAVELSGAVAYNGVIYLIGGYTGSVKSTVVQYATINSNGADTSTWSATTSLSIATQAAETAEYDGYVYVMGGVQAATVSTIVYFPINNGGGNGGDSPFGGTSTVSSGLASSSIVASGDYIYEVGGNVSGSGSTQVLYAPINASGSIGTWTSTSSLNTGVFGESTIAYNGYIYSIGGFSSAYSTVVQYAPICTGQNTIGSCTTSSTPGTLGTWSNTGSNHLGTAVDNATTETMNGYLYLLGGVSTGATNQTTVQYALLNSSGGGTGSWSTTTALPVATSGAGSILYNNCIYIIGGSTGTSSPAATANGYTDCYSSAGLLGGSWSSVNSLPVAEQNAPVIYIGGYVYVLGGENTGGTTSEPYVFAPMYSNGVLGAWQQTTTGITGTSQDSQVSVFNGILYNLNSAGTTVEYAGVNSIPLVGTYTSLINLGYGTNVYPATIVSDGSNTVNPGYGATDGSGGVSVEYSSSTATCNIFSSPTAVNSSGIAQLSTPYELLVTSDGCGNSTAGSQYLFLEYILDDSLSESFPNISSNNSSISLVQIDYHPNPASRLRGGQTFINNAPTGLDSPPSATQ
jgi:N-acetylneuraminic acid mutarotase